MTKGTHLLRSALLALLALAVISGGSLAAGDLFDDDYKDCPHKTRLRDGQIADLSVNRDAEDEDEVNVSWVATDPATWGLGANAYRTSLVVLLDDGITKDKSLLLGSKKTTFDGVDTGRKVTVQMAIVVDTADGKYLISDILEKTVNQSLTAPSFSSSWYRIRAGGAAADAVIGSGGDAVTVAGALIPDARLKDRPSDLTAVTGAAIATLQKRFEDVRKAKDFQYDSDEIANGSMYYIGYNENFANYTAGTADYEHSPSTQRLRIGLAHSSEEDNDDRDNVDFEAYLIRIVDSDGDVVDEADDVPTIPNNYGTARTFYSYDTDLGETGDNTQGFKAAARKLFIDDLAAGDSTADPPTFPGGLTFADKKTSLELQNVRISEGPDDFTVGMHLAPESSLDRPDTRAVTPSQLSIIKVGVSAAVVPDPPPALPQLGNNPTTEGGQLEVGDIYANPPDEYRNFPIDTLSSDVKYTISAWAVNEDDEVISPVATLTVSPINERVTLGSDPITLGLRDYLNTTVVAAGAGVNSGTLIVTEFTVLK